jgi:hypothetical protein
MMINHDYVFEMKRQGEGSDWEEANKRLSRRLKYGRDLKQVPPQYDRTMTPLRQIVRWILVFNSANMTTGKTREGEQHYVSQYMVINVWKKNLHLRDPPPRNWKPYMAYSRSRRSSASRRQVVRPAAVLWNITSVILEYVIFSVSNFSCYRLCRYVALNTQRFTRK